MHFSFYSDVEEQEKSSEFAKRQRRNSLSCEQDLPAGETTQLVWQDWIKLKETYNELTMESSKRRKAEKKVAELTHEIELHTIQEERRKVLEEQQRSENADKNANLQNNIDELKSQLQVNKDLVNNLVHPLSSCKPEEMVKMLEQLIIGLIAKLPESAPLLERLLQECTEALTKADCGSLDNESKINLALGIMALVNQQLREHPDRGFDVLLKMMRENTNLLEKLNCFYLDKDSRMKLASGIESMMASVNQRLGEYPDLSFDVLLQVMQENTMVLNKLKWFSLDDGSRITSYVNRKLLTHV